MVKNSLFKFLIITFVITWLVWWALIILTKLNMVSFSHPLSTALNIIGGFGPTIAALFVLNGKSIIKRSP